MSEDEEIRDVMREERSRGRRPIDIDERKKARRLLERIRRAILDGDERALVKILHEAGHEEDSREFQTALKIFCEATGRR
jgi:hypothetical protein